MPEQHIAHQLLINMPTTSRDRPVLSIWTTCDGKVPLFNVHRRDDGKSRNDVTILVRNWNSARLKQVIILTSRDDDQSARASKGSLSVDELLARLQAHIAALEAELASYASKYGLTDKARELLLRPIGG